MKKKLTALSVIALALAVSGCSSSSSSSAKTSKITGSAVQPTSLTDADVAELLLTPDQWLTAKSHFEKILAAQPNHPKALYYSASFDLMEIGRGGLDRARGLISNAEQSRRYGEFQDKVESLGSSDLSQFLRGARTPSTREDWRKFATETAIPQIEKSLEKLSRIQSGAEIRFPVVSWTDPVYRENCQLSGSTWSCLQLSDDKTVRFDFDMNDVQMMKLYLMGYLNYFRVLTALSLTGAEAFETATESAERARGRSLTFEESVRLVRRFHEYGKVDAAHALGKIHGDLETGLKIVSALEQINREVCRNQTRMNSLLIFKSICFFPHEIEEVSKVNRALLGPTEISLGYDSRGQQVNIITDVSRLISNLRGGYDMKDLLPTKFDSNGKPTAFPDGTFLGLFPKGDLPAKLRELKDGRSSASETISSILEPAFRNPRKK